MSLTEHNSISIDSKRSRRCHRFSRLMSAHPFLLNSISTGLSGRLGLVCVFRPQRDAAGARRVTRQEQLRADQKRSKHLGVMRKAVHAKILFGVRFQAQPTEQLAQGGRSHYTFNWGIRVLRKCCTLFQRNAAV